MKLSILLGSVPTRLKSFSVIEDLCKQAEGKSVEILYLGDNFSMSVGEKRNKLMDLAKGEYITFVDDDDRVDSKYINSILDSINNSKNNPSCITFLASVKLNNGPAKICHYQVGLANNYNTPTEYFRQPNHLMVWKRDILEKFPEINCGEDNEFGKKMNSKLESLKTQGSLYHNDINKVLYHYDFDSNTTEAQK